MLEFVLLAYDLLLQGFLLFLVPPRSLIFGKDGPPFLD